MGKIKVTIERAADGTYSAYCEDVPAYGMGITAEAAKAEALEGLRLYIEETAPDSLPAILKKPYEVVYQMDVQSLLDYYKGIFTNAAFERITGINQRQIQHYSSGLKNPGTETRKKIETALHKLGDELLAVEL